MIRHITLAWRRALAACVLLAAIGVGSVVGAATRDGGGASVGYRALTISRFTSEAAVRGLDLHGVSLDTPWNEIVAKLKEGGWDEIGSPRPDEVRQFLQGPRTPAAGQTTRSVMLQRSARGFELTFGWRAGGVYEARPPREPLPEIPEVHAARRLKALICDGIPDPRERHAACPPDTAAEIVAGSIGKESLLLTPRVHVVKLRATAAGVTIALRRTGG
jgi:hypothetical protein